ncbi:MAG: penicillin-insensitive murein endopeptidase, partial [Myxococcales bacterium]|nr:penicillin-insensitive murein endopeptidase [Myxococcales bacterium]
ETETGAETGADATARVLTLDASHTTSLGAPGFGTLQGGVALPDVGPGFIHNPRRPHEARFGTVEMVQAIIKAAMTVEREMPGSGLVVNDICLEQGGPLRQHGSHQNGRDADILFYAKDRDGKPYPAVGVPIEPDLSGWDYKDLSVPEDDVQLWLDADRTWRFMQALLEEAGDHVQRIFIVEHVRTALLDAADRAKAPRGIRDRFAMITCQPGTPHDDHMHVRFFCAPDDIAAGCIDKAPMYPWHRQQLKALGVEPVMETWKDRQQAKRAVAARITTREQARKKAVRKYGKLHRDVRAFLKRREAWSEKPSPGRPYCR